MRPMTDKLIVIKDEAKNERVSSGGIVLGKAKDTDKTPCKGRVLEVAPNLAGVEAGDIVIFGKFVGIPVILDDATTVFILDKSEVLAIM